MNPVLNKKEDNKAFFTIEIPAKDFENAVQKAYLKNRNYFVVPGFRKGKVPRKIIEMNYGEEIFYEEALNSLLPDAYEEAIEELKLDPVDYPEIDVEDIEKGKTVIVTAEVTIKPEAELGDYKNIEIEKIEYNVSDEDVEMELKTIQEMNARIIVAEDRETKEGDILTIDYEGYVDGEQFEGGTAENQELTLGSDTFIPGFEEQLIGKNKNDEVEVKVNFPEEYFEESLEGKEAIFKVTIHEIKEKELPVLDDEFAIDVSEFDTLAEYKEDLRQNLEKELKEREKVEIENAVVDKIVELSNVEIPDVMVENQIENEIRQFAYSLQMQGLELEQYFQFTNSNLEDFKAQVEPVAKEKVRADLVLDAISKEEGIEISDEDVDMELERLAKEYMTEDIEKFKEDMKKGDLEFLKKGIIREKTIELLVSNVKFVE
ncbi:MAG: trigger factor [Tissierellia bacterium]|nr:trigger factor [Tissierellia bacterium]